MPSSGRICGSRRISRASDSWTRGNISKRPKNSQHPNKSGWPCSWREILRAQPRCLAVPAAPRRTTTGATRTSCWVNTMRPLRPIKKLFPGGPTGLRLNRICRSQSRENRHWHHRMTTMAEPAVSWKLTNLYLTRAGG